MHMPCGSVPVYIMPPSADPINTAQEELRLRVMRVLEDNPEASQRDIAKKLGVSLGSVNFCVKALVDIGFVKLNNFVKSNKKLGYAYILTPEGISEKAAITARFLKRKMNEYEMLREEIEQLKREIEAR